MANIKSAKKQAKKALYRQKINLARKSSLKTAIKKVLLALEQKSDKEQLNQLLKDAEAKIARARGKGLIHANTAARKVSNLARRVSQASR